VTVDHKDTDSMQILTIQSVNQTTRTITFTANASVNYPPFSTVHAFKRHIPDGKVLFMPEPLPGANEDVLPLGYAYMTPHEWGPPGSLLSPGSGIFLEPHIHENDDPKRIELISGFAGMVALWRRNVHGLLTVF
jgi:hypothetical protein